MSGIAASERIIMRPTIYVVRNLSAGLLLAAALVVSCGQDGPSLSDYVESLNAMDAQFSARGEAIWATYLEKPASTIDDLRALMDANVALRIDVDDALDAIDAPEHIADMHADWVVWHSRLLDAERAQTARAATAASVEEFLESEELRAWVAVLEQGSMLCAEVEARLNATEAREVFADTPWMPGDLTEVVHAAIGCQNFPEDFSDVPALFGH
jgi:hypothetical protein